MSSEQEQIRSLAGRIARRLAENASTENGGGHTPSGDSRDLAALRAGLAELQQRLAHLESHIAHDDSCEEESLSSTSSTSRTDITPASNSPRTMQQQMRGEAVSRTTTPTRSTWLSGTYMPATEHPSEERFDVGEAVSELVDFFEREKMCSVEPGEKPCDHCSMCSSRGF